MINVVTIDGGSGSLRGSKLGKQFKRLLKCYGKQPIRVSYLRSATFPFLILRAIRKWKIRKRVRKYDSHQNTLILAGKSLGAVWALDLLEDMDADLQYRDVFLCTVDSHDPLDKSSPYPFSATISKGWNVYQRRERLLGSKIAHVLVENIQVNRAGVNHWNIIFCQETIDAIHSTIRAALRIL